MPDREKVIETLEKAKLVIESWVPMFEQYNTPAGIDVAIALLKEQEPVEPDGVNCGECGYTVHRINFIGPYGGLRYERFRFCPACGKEVKWND